MVKELQVMKDKHVYKVVPQPTDKNVVQSQWVFANKYDEAGLVSAHKVCLVAKGFTQVLGEDYNKTYALVACLELVHLVCAIATSLSLCLWQVDFMSAFLNSKNTYKVYMEQPPGFEEGGDNIWLLLKTLYGTMQGAHNWACMLEHTYQGHGYKTSRADPQVHFQMVQGELTLMLTWTDNILRASSIELGEIKAKEELKKSHELKDLGVAKYILGMKIERDKNTGNIWLSQWAYSKRILECFNMSDAKICSTLLKAGTILSIKDCPQSTEEALEMKDVPYHKALGCLMWLQVATCPDVMSFPMSISVRISSIFTPSLFVLSFP
jgi:hypothetical protein